MVGSISWVINAYGNGEIVKPVQDYPAPVMPTPTLADPILKPVPRSSSSPRACRSAPHRPRKPIDQDDLITSIDRVDKSLVECLSLVESVLDRSAYDDEFPPLQHFRAVGPKRSARSRRSRWQDADLIIMATPKGRTVQRRPLSRSDLPRDDREASAADIVVAHPFGLANAATIYQEAMRDRYAD